MIEVCFTEEEFILLGKMIDYAVDSACFWEPDGKIEEGILKSLETASKPMLYTSENKQRIKE